MWRYSCRLCIIAFISLNLVINVPAFSDDDRISNALDRANQSLDSSYGNGFVLHSTLIDNFSDQSQSEVDLRNRIENNNSLHTDESDKLELKGPRAGDEGKVSKSNEEESIVDQKDKDYIEVPDETPAEEIGIPKEALDYINSRNGLVRDYCALLSEDIYKIIWVEQTEDYRSVQLMVKAYDLDGNALGDAETIDISEGNNVSNMSLYRGANCDVLDVLYTTFLLYDCVKVSDGGFLIMWGAGLERTIIEERIVPNNMGIATTKKTGVSSVLRYKSCVITKDGTIAGEASITYDGGSIPGADSAYIMNNSDGTTLFIWSADKTMYSQSYDLYGNKIGTPRKLIEYSQYSNWNVMDSFSMPEGRSALLINNADTHGHCSTRLDVKLLLFDSSGNLLKTNGLTLTLDNNSGIFAKEVVKAYKLNDGTLVLNTYESEYTHLVNEQGKNEIRQSISVSFFDSELSLIRSSEIHHRDMYDVFLYMGDMVSLPNGNILTYFKTGYRVFNSNGKMYYQHYLWVSDRSGNVIEEPVLIRSDDPDTGDVYVLEEKKTLSNGNTILLMRNMKLVTSGMSVYYKHRFEIIVIDSKGRIIRDECFANEKKEWMSMSFSHIEELADGNVALIWTEAGYLGDDDIWKEKDDKDIWYRLAIVDNSGRIVHQRKSIGNDIATKGSLFIEKVLTYENGNFTLIYKDKIQPWGQEVETGAIYIEEYKPNCEMLSHIELEEIGQSAEETVANIDDVRAIGNGKYEIVWTEDLPKQLNNNPVRKKMEIESGSGYSPVVNNVPNINPIIPRYSSIPAFIDYVWPSPYVIFKQRNSNISPYGSNDRSGFSWDDNKEFPLDAYVSNIDDNSYAKLSTDLTIDDFEFNSGINIQDSIRNSLSNYGYVRSASFNDHYTGDLRSYLEALRNKDTLLDVETSILDASGIILENEELLDDGVLRGFEDIAVMIGSNDAVRNLIGEANFTVIVDTFNLFNTDIKNLYARFTNEVSSAYMEIEKLLSIDIEKEIMNNDLLLPHGINITVKRKIVISHKMEAIIDSTEQLSEDHKKAVDIYKNIVMPLRDRYIKALNKAVRDMVRKVKETLKQEYPFALSESRDNLQAMIMLDNRVGSE